MTKPYWFAVKAEFTCPNCKKLSTEILYVNASSPDPTPIAQGVSTQNMVCQLCKTPLVTGVHVSLNVLPVTLAQAKAAGFKPPADLLG
jgi:hypothetical protein